MKTLRERISDAIERLNKGHAPMRVPASMSDPDIVLMECSNEIERLEKEATAQEERLRNAVDLSAEFRDRTLEMQNAAIDLAKKNEALEADVKRLQAEALEYRGCSAEVRPLKSYEHAHGKHVVKPDPECVICKGLETRDNYLAAIGTLIGVVCSGIIPPIMSTTVLTLAASRSQTISALLHELRKR